MAKQGEDREGKNVYTFSLRFIMHVCEERNNRDRVDSTRKSSFYEDYRRELSGLRAEVDVLEMKVNAVNNKISELERARDYFGKGFESVSEEGYYDLPDWLRVLFEEEGDEYVVRIDEKTSQLKREKKRLDDNLQEKQRRLENVLQTIMRIDDVEEDDWEELLKIICNGDFDYSRC